MYSGGGDGAGADIDANRWGGQQLLTQDDITAAIDHITKPHPVHAWKENDWSIKTMTVTDEGPLHGPFGRSNPNKRTAVLTAPAHKDHAYLRIVFTYYAIDS